MVARVNIWSLEFPELTAQGDSIIVTILLFGKGQKGT